MDEGRHYTFDVEIDVSFICHGFFFRFFEQIFFNEQIRSQNLTSIYHVIHSQMRS